MRKKAPSAPRRHWMDAAVSGGFDPKLVEDVKVLLKILYLFIPMPVFWALFDQQGSRWTFQAARFLDALINFFLTFFFTFLSILG